MQQAIQHCGDSGAVAQQFSPVVYGPVGRQQGTGTFVAAHALGPWENGPFWGTSDPLVPKSRIERSPSDTEEAGVTPKAIV
jgi:hypothetical protein